MFNVFSLGTEGKEISYLWDYLLPEVPFPEEEPDFTMKMSEIIENIKARGITLVGRYMVGDVTGFSKRDFEILTYLKRLGYSYRGNP